MDGLEQPRRRPAGFDAPVAQAQDLRLPARLDEIFLEGKLAGRGGQPGLHPLVGHGQHRGPHPQRLAQRGGDARQRLPLGQEARAGQVGGDVPVPQMKPGLAAEPLELVQHGKGIVADTPPLGGIDEAGEGVDDGVDVGRYVKAVHHRVVGGVAHHRQIFGCGLLVEAQNELCAAGASREEHQCPGTEVPGHRCRLTGRRPSGP